MKPQILAIVTYAVILVVGGYIGYSASNSIPSLAMGTFFAVALIACAWAMSIGLPFAYMTSIILTAILAAFFTFRFTIAYKFMPAGLMALISMAMLVYLIVWRPK